MELKQVGPKEFAWMDSEEEDEEPNGAHVFAGFA